MSVSHAFKHPATINMYRHQLNCISFIAKQQQLLRQLASSCKVGAERRQVMGSRANGVKFYFTSVPFADAGAKKGKQQKKNTYKMKGDARGAAQLNCEWDRWRLPLSEAASRRSTPVAKQWEQWLRKRFKHKHNFSKSFFTFFILQSQSIQKCCELSSYYLKIIFIGCFYLFLTATGSKFKLIKYFLFFCFKEILISVILFKRGASCI